MCRCHVFGSMEVLIFSVVIWVCRVWHDSSFSVCVCVCVQAGLAARSCMPSACGATMCATPHPSLHNPSLHISIHPSIPHYLSLFNPPSIHPCLPLHCISMHPSLSLHSSLPMFTSVHPSRSSFSFSIPFSIPF